MWLEKLQEVKFKSEKKKKKKKKKIKKWKRRKVKNKAFLLEQKPKFFVMSIIEKFLKCFRSKVMGNSLEVIFVKITPFFAIFCPLLAQKF